jgi:hypothetical protein
LKVYKKMLEIKKEKRTKKQTIIMAIVLGLGVAVGSKIIAHLWPSIKEWFSF